MFESVLLAAALAAGRRGGTPFGPRRPARIPEAVFRRAGAVRLLALGVPMLARNG